MFEKNITNEKIYIYMVLKYAGRAGNKYPVQSKYGYLPEK